MKIGIKKFAPDNKWLMHSGLLPVKITHQGLESNRVAVQTANAHLNFTPVQV